MKKLITIVLVIMAFTALKVHSQNIRLNGYALYTMDDDIETTDGANYFRGTIKANLLWGVGLEFNAARDYGLELAYYRQDTDFPATYNTLLISGGETTVDKTFQIGANYILLGGTRYLIIPRSPVEPYLGAMLGIAIIENKNPVQGASSSETKFAWELKAGLNIWASKQVAFKLQMQLLSAAQTYGAGFYTYGTGYGTSYSSMYQFGIGGGLTFRFGK